VAQLVREKTGKQVSVRTVRRIGKEELGAKKARGRKRTAEESEYSGARGREIAFMQGERHTDFSDAFLLFIFSVA
jgi:hypothetical protein